MSPQFLREQWTKKYREAAGAFIAIQTFGLLALCAAWFIALKQLGETIGSRERLSGILCVVAGVLLVIGTGLVKKWRWAAVAGLLWCVGNVLCTITLFFVAGTEPPSAAQPGRNLAFDAGASAGMCCPGVLTLILLISTARAAFAKAPPKEEAEAAPIDLFAPDLNPYGLPAHEPAPRKPIVARLLIGVGAAAIVGGAVLIGMSFVFQHNAASLAKGEWQQYRGDGFLIEFPGKPTKIPDIIEGEQIEKSNRYSWSSQFHRFEVTHYRLREGYYVPAAAPEQNLENLLIDMQMDLESSSEPTFPNARALRQVARSNTDESRAELLVVVRGRNVFVVTGIEGDPDVSSAAARFVDSFELE